MIKSKQLEDTLRSESNPFDTIYSDRTVGDLNGAIRFTALNNTGATINAYSVVYINGVSGNTPTIALADADTAAMPAFGLTVAQVTTGNEVDVITFGNLKGVDTSLLSVGTVLYVSATPGEYTDTPPTGSSAKLQNIGMVVKSDANGIIKVGGAGRSAATPNLDEGKFFIGNASNQSSQSAYSLPTADGSANQVLSTDGSGQLSFVDQAGGSTITTTRTTSSTINASLNERYILDSTSSNVTVNLPQSPSTGDFVLIFPRYYNTTATISSSDQNVAAAGFTPEASSVEVTFNSNEEVLIVYTGTEWVVESKNRDVVFSGNTSLNLSTYYFSRYSMIFMTTTGDLTITLPSATTLYEKSKLEFVCTAESYRDVTLTINAAAGESTVNLVGTTNVSTGLSTVTLPTPRRFTIQMYNNKFYIIPSFSERAGVVDHLNVIPYSSLTYSGTAIDLSKNTRYFISASQPAEVNLPQLSTLSNYGDFVEVNQVRSYGTPNYITVNLNTNDAASAIFTGLGFNRSNDSSIDSIKVPLTTGILRLTKSGGNTWVVQLIQTGFGSPIVLDTNGTTSYDLDAGMTYIVDTASIGANTTLNLPYPYDEMSTVETIIKVLDDTYDVIIDPNSTSTIDGSSTITLSAGASALKTLNITPYTQGKYIVLSNY